MLVVTDHDGGFGEEIKVVKADGALQLLLEDRVEDFSPAHIGKYTRSFFIIYRFVCEHTKKRLFIIYRFVSYSIFKSDGSHSEIALC